MKLRRDAPLPAEAMAYYQTPRTQEQPWRNELARVGIVAGVMFVAGAFVTGTAVIFWRSWDTVAAGAWLTGLAIVAYIAFYAYGLHTDSTARRRLDLARMDAEHAALQMLDTNADGKADDSEVETFIAYVMRLHRGERSTAASAQAQGVAGPEWTRYKDWLIANGYANPVQRRGGTGFALKPSVMRTPWPKLEQNLRRKVQAGLGAGLVINDARPSRSAEPVSSLDD